jgi:hypothetical protein
MVNKTLMARVAALEAAGGPCTFRGMLEYDDQRETPAAAVLRASGSGLYAVIASSTNVGYLCEIAADRHATMHTAEGQEVVPW